nr:Ig-like domain-containing protein [Lysinibacter cavernae]
MRGTVNLLVPFPACGSTTEPSPTADVEVAKDGPATVFENGVVTYTITVTNHGPSAAAGVTAYDQLPTGFTLDPASTTGTVNSGRISWSLGDLGVNETITLSFSGTATAPVGTILTNGAIASSTTPDTAPSNNDGTSESSRVSTEVIATPPPANVAPVANDLTRDTSTRLLEVGQVQASDADAGQKLTYTKATSPAHGNVYFTASGGFVYLSDADFSGFDSFDYQVCDNGTPVLCDTATVTFNVYPRAIDDNAQTFEASPVAIPLLANDIPGSQLETTITATPANGQVSVNATAGVATYVPADGFTGTDTFEYQICSLTSPQLCAIATVTVTVIAENNPPVVQPLTQITVVDSATTETVTATDPNAGDILTDESGIPPRSGSVSVDAGGTVVYTPHHGFAGRDEYTVIVCDDGTPQLCATGLVSVEILPLASPDLATTRAGTPVSIEVLTNDAGTVSAPTVASQPTNGSVSITGGTAVYTPATGFVGTDSFTYTICALEAADLCATTTATITVTAAQPGTTPPGTTQPPAHGGNASGPSTGGLAVTGANDPIAPALGWAALAAGFACIAAARSRKQRQI